MRRLAGLSAAGFAGLIAGGLSAVRAGDPSLYPAAPAAPVVEVLLFDNGFHTDLALPRARLATGGGPLAAAVRGLPPGEWVLVGWGDADFYVDPRPIAARLPDGARAFFRPGGNPSAVMLDPTATAALPPLARGVRLNLSEAGFDRLGKRIEASLRIDAAGEPVPVASRTGGGARFFAARERFWIGRLCNHWTAEVLNAGGLSMPIVRSLFSGEVARAAERASQLDSSARRD